MKLVLRKDVYYAATSGGVTILTHHGPVRLAGASIGQWLDRLAPHLDGRYTLAELTAGLASEPAAMVEKIVTVLRENGVVRERLGAQPDIGQAGEYAPEIRFVDYFGDSAIDAFTDYRARTALVVGTGPVYAALVRAALHSGLHRVKAVQTEQLPAPTYRIDATSAPQWCRDPAQEVQWHRMTGNPEPEPTTLLDGVDLVIQVTADRDINAATALAQRCAVAGIPLAQVLMGCDEAWLSLAGIADPATADVWSAAWPRRGAAPIVTTPTPRKAPAPADAGPARAVSAVVANRLLHGVFRGLTGTRPTPAQLTRVDLRTLHSRAHSFLPHPLALRATADPEADFRDRIAALAQGERLTEEAFSRRLVPCVDDQFGLIALTERDWAQIPLNVSEAVTADPVGLERAAAPRVVLTGYGFDAARARCAAALRAVARYGVLMLDPRRLVSDDGKALVDQAGVQATDLVAAIAALRSRTVAGNIWGQVVGDTGAARLVLADVAFPALHPHTPHSTALAGVAAGYDWHTAIENGLVGQCQRLTLAIIGAQGVQYPRVDVAAVALDPSGARCLGLLADLGKLPEVYELTGRLGVPTFAFCGRDHTVAYTSALTAVTAIGEGLLQALLAVQAEAYGQSDYAPPCVQDFPRHLRDETGPARPPGPDIDAATASDNLRRSGCMAVAVPLDHDPALAELMPYVVNVVIDEE